MSEKLVLIIGGARSGKSAYALTLGGMYPEPRAFLATAEALDDEMAQRIAQHRRMRPSSWETIEEPLKVVEVLEGSDSRYRVIVLDCLTLWLSNLLGHYGDEAKVLAELERLLAIASHRDVPLLVVSNEVGMGIVPEGRLARLFRDLVGSANARLAALADEVYVMFAGLPLKLK
ncbi:MAG: bifunctional adenosylcobinamide kinase/adenosylcobinamide-phosphate guanylyltransferase [Candidatus Methylomirabilales bacterium]